MGKGSEFAVVVLPVAPWGNRFDGVPMFHYSVRGYAKKVIESGVNATAGALADGQREISLGEYTVNSIVLHCDYFFRQIGIGIIFYIVILVDVPAEAVHPAIDKNFTSEGTTVFRFASVKASSFTAVGPSTILRPHWLGPFLSWILSQCSTTNSPSKRRSQIRFFY